jgi:hypothetical protein
MGGVLVDEWLFSRIGTARSPTTSASAGIRSLRSRMSR